MLSCKNKKKKGQVGQTIFWIAATLVIAGLLTIFIFASIGLSTLKDLKLLLSSDSNSNLKGESQVLTEKTILAFELNNANKEYIEAFLKENEK